MPKTSTHTHNEQELYFLRAALLKFAKEEEAAAASNRACGFKSVAEKQRAESEALVGTVGNRDGSTYDRITQLIAGANGKAVSFDYSEREAHALALGLPKLAKRLRALVGEMESLGNLAYAEALPGYADHIDTTLLDHYGEQKALPLED